MKSELKEFMTGLLYLTFVMLGFFMMMWKYGHFPKSYFWAILLFLIFVGNQVIKKEKIKHWMVIFFIAIQLLILLSDSFFHTLEKLTF